MERANLHNHTEFSDGKFSPEDIIEAAIGFGLDRVAVVDHYKTSKVRSLGPERLPEYIGSVRALEQTYRDRIKVNVGLEIDSSPQRTDFNAFPYDLTGRLDFVLFEYVEEANWGGMPFWSLLKHLDGFQCPVGLAHNDIGKNFSHIPPAELVEVLSTNRVFVELSSGTRYSKFSKQFYHYAEGFFAKASGSELKVSVGSDTHNNIDDVGRIDDAYAFIKKFGLEGNLLDRVL